MFSYIGFNLLQLIKKPYLFFGYFKKIGSVLILKRSYFLLFLARLIKENPENVVACSFGAKTYNIITRNNFYKVAFFSECVKKEKENYHFISENFPMLNVLLPEIQYYHSGFANYIKIDRYSAVKESEAVDYANSVLSLLRHYGNKRVCALNNFKHIQHGIRLSGILYGKIVEKQLAQAVENILSMPWTIGPVHGDFYLSNLLKSDNAPKIIDLDGFAIEGLQSLDAFNFIVDLKAKRSGMKWPEMIMKIKLESKQDLQVQELGRFFDYDLGKVSLLYALSKLAYENYHYHFLSNSVRADYLFIKDLI